ncbi:hypothetical protein TRICI_002126 [Trichomonascus ciferrii]|uniref:CENP-V/GFA domain-containing protein n=1 Tax=Trichomonascus ciferrii TaxID=44093 RepID=A0A642V7I9_9ASCO|nr:hypothetical protein TRICI_002126 [Trichomonascus ciferrii]
MSNKYSGACLCESVKFSVGDAKSKFICYCIDCRKNSGHLGQLLAKFDTEDLSIDDPTGQLKEYTITRTSSGFPKKKVFCNTCGCTIMTQPMKYEGKVSILRVTLLDNGIETFLPEKCLFQQERETYLGEVACEFL